VRVNYRKILGTHSTERHARLKQRMLKTRKRERNELPHWKRLYTNGCNNSTHHHFFTALSSFHHRCFLVSFLRWQ